MIKNKSGESYVEVCITVVVFVSLIVVALNIFNFITLHAEMDRLAEDLVETAAYAGGFTADFQDRVTELKSTYGSFTVSYTADEYFNSSLGRVQLGTILAVTVSKNTTVQGLGVFSIPVTVSTSRSGLSERYWK